MSMYAERLASLHGQSADHLCVGIDAHLNKVTGRFFLSERDALSPEDFLVKMGQVLLEVAAGNRVASVKFQSAFFEAVGAPGLNALGQLIAGAQKRGLLTILDVKRGDIASTMAAYGEACFDRLGADAITVLPYMGLDTVEALRPWLQRGKGVYVVWISSNTGSEWVQEPVANALLDHLQGWLTRTSLSGSCGLVLGATKAEVIPEELFRRATGFPLLMPGFGAQAAAFGNRIEGLRHTNPWYVLPVSRAVSGFGLAGTEDEIGSCQSWDDYGRFCEKRLANIRETLK